MQLRKPDARLSETTFLPVLHILRLTMQEKGLTPFLPNILQIPIHFRPVLDSVDSHDLLSPVNPIKNAPVAYS